MNKYNKISKDYFDLSPNNKLKSIKGIDVPLVEKFDNEIDEIVTDKTKKSIIETVFAQKSLGSIKKTKQGNFAKGGVTNIDGQIQEVWTPREFLYRQFNPDWRENPYIITEEESISKLEKVNENKVLLEQHIVDTLEKYKKQTIFELPLSEYDVIKDKRREIQNISNFLTIAELDAYVFAHPELIKENYIDDYTYSKEDLIDKGLLYWQPKQYDGTDSHFKIKVIEGKWVYKYEYLMGNVNQKIVDLDRDEDKFLQDASKEQLALQISELTKVRNEFARVGVSGQNQITLKANSDFGNDTDMFWIDTIIGALQLNGRTSLKDAFIMYLSSDIIDPTTFTLVESYRDIVRYYCNNETPNSDGSEEEERNKVNILQNSQIEGQKLFNSFLDTELIREDKQRFEYEWNRYYNNYVECVYHKIPVALSFSKTFLDNVPFIPNDTQIQSVQYASVTKSCMLAYGVGVGKTASAFMNISWALGNGLIKKPMIVSPSAVLPKWIGEIQGKEEINALGVPTGTFIQGLLPQYGETVNLGSLNAKEVRFNLKEYSEAEEVLLSKMDNFVEWVRENIDRKKYAFEDTDINRIILSNIDDFELDNVISDYNRYLAPFQPVGLQPPKKKTKPKEMFDFWWTEQQKYISELPFKLGKLRSFSDNTIFMISHTGIGKLGAYKPSIEEDINETESFFGKLYYELTQGQDIEDDEGSGFANRLEANVFGKAGKPKVYLEELGVDYICFDESHYYKKAITVAKAKDNVRGAKKYDIDKGSPSERSLSAYMMVRYIQERNNNFGILHLTATPVTNSPIEIYSMMALTNIKQLYNMGFEYVETFFDCFMRINYDIRYTAQRKIKKEQVLLGYINAPQMRRAIFSIFDYKSGEDANIKRPIKVTYPNIPKGIETTLTPSAEQGDSFRSIKEYILGEKTYSEICEVSTTETNQYSEMNDEELVQAYEDLTGKEVDLVGELDDKTRDKFIKALEDAQSNTQTFGTFEEKKEPKGARVIKALSMLRQVTISPYLYMCKKRSAIEPTSSQYIETSPKLLYIVNCIKNTLAYEKKNKLVPSGSVIFMNQGVKPMAMIPSQYQETSAGRVATAFDKVEWKQGGFDKIKQYIVDNSELEAEQIGLIYGGLTKIQKVREMDKFLKGETLVLIGSKTISTGIDLQKNASTMYFADFDWNPTEAEQTVGRIHRQGNRMAYTRIVYPMLENSADPIIFQILQEKTMRIREIWDKEGRTSELEISKEFDANEFKHKLITDPEEKAKYHIELSIKDLTDNAIVYRNRLKSFQNLSYDYQTMNEERPILKKGLSIIDHYANDKNKKATLEALDSKVENITDEIEDEIRDWEYQIENLEEEIERLDSSNKDDKKEIDKNNKEITSLKSKIKLQPERLKKKIAKIKEDAYDVEADPDKRYVLEDFNNLNDEELVLQVQKKLTDSTSWYTRNTGGWSDKNNIDEWIKQNYSSEYFGRNADDEKLLKDEQIAKAKEVKEKQKELGQIAIELADVEAFSSEEVELEEKQDQLTEELDDLKREYNNITENNSGMDTSKAIRIENLKNRGYSWRNAYRQYERGKDRILALGLDPANLTEVLSKIREELQAFETEISTIQDSESELINKFRLEEVANRKELPTISERVMEFAGGNDSYLTKFLHTFKIDTVPTIGANKKKDTSTTIMIGMTKPKNYIGEINIELLGSKKQSIDIVVGDEVYEIAGGEVYSLGDFNIEQFEQLLVDNDELGNFEFFDWCIADGVEGGKPKLRNKPVAPPVKPPIDVTPIDVTPIDVTPIDVPNISKVEEYLAKIESYESLIEIEEDDEIIADHTSKIESYESLIELEEE